MKGFFSRYHSYREMEYKLKNEFAGMSKEESDRALFLSLFYSTDLSAQKIQALSFEDGKRILESGMYQGMDPDTRTLLTGKLSGKTAKKASLFGKEIASGSAESLQSLVQKNADEKFKKRMRSTRVFCSNSEYNVLPTPLRLNADPRYSGKGICIAFLDGGFYPHPDLMKPSRRVVAYKDLASPYRPKSDFEKPDEHSWHGMQTCVSAVGNGHLSQGIYRGIAYEANVAQLKVMGEFGFTTEAITSAIEWCIRKKNRYNLKVINISLGMYGQGSFRESVINHAAEEAVQAGINVVVAAGNDWSGPITPPGNSPSVITVGGLDDHNSLDSEDHGMYHSSFGMTADGIMKPEIIAPGIWVAAPTLPGTAFFREAELTWNLAYETSKDNLIASIEEAAPYLTYKEHLSSLPFREKLEFLKRKASEFKLVSPYYQHVDGTSFSAPIICSIIAQMLEVNPDLTPKNVKDILMETARRLDNVPVEAQGCGVVQARAAVELAQKRIKMLHVDYPVVKDDQVELQYEDLSASSVEVLGSFNDWKAGLHKMKKEDHSWKIRFRLPEQGTYPYKFLVDAKDWVDDPLNSSKSYDGYGGFNSLVHIYGSAAMRKELEEISKRLAKIKSVKKQSEEHKQLLCLFDRLIMGKNAARSPQVQGFFEKRMNKVLSDLEERTVDSGIFLYQLYNSGYIIQTPTLKLGIDLVSTRHVWDVYWDVEEKLFEDLADTIDLAFVTQRLPDHLDLDVVNRLISRDRLVVVPSGMESLCLNGVIGFEPGETRDLYSLGRETIPVNIEAHPAEYRMMSAADLDMRIYKITIQEKLNLLHTAEMDYTHFLRQNSSLLERLKPVDILITSLPMKQDEQAFFEFVNRLDPDVLIPSHLGELGQSEIEVRGSYQRAYDLFSRTGKEFEVLLWGDSVKIANL